MSAAVFIQVLFVGEEWFEIKPKPRAWSSVQAQGNWKETVLGVVCKKAILEKENGKRDRERGKVKVKKEKAKREKVKKEKAMVWKKATLEKEKGKKKKEREKAKAKPGQKKTWNMSGKKWTERLKKVSTQVCKKAVEKPKDT